jgi:predicted ribonuclease toxin of YeeF-YezG toxin-antitoxin module
MKRGTGMNLIRNIVFTLFSLCLAFSPLDANAGLLGKGAKLYTAAKVLKMARTANKYRKQVAHVSKIPFNAKQIGLLKNCLKTRSCMTWKKNSQDFSDTIRNKVIKEWEAATGQSWPKYTKDLLTADGRVFMRKGNRYDAHHIIPKKDGGPHEWWNMHPVPRPMHQADIHATNGFLNQFLALGKP